MGGGALLHRGAPVRRVAALDTHVAEPTLEEAILPQVDDIAVALTDLCGF